MDKDSIQTLASSFSMKRGCTPFPLTLLGECSTWNKFLMSCLCTGGSSAYSGQQQEHLQFPATARACIPQHISKHQASLNRQDNNRSAVKTSKQFPCPMCGADGQTWLFGRHPNLRKRWKQMNRCQSLQDHLLRR